MATHTPCNAFAGNTYLSVPGVWQGSRSGFHLLLSWGSHTGNVNACVRVLINRMEDMSLFLVEDEDFAEVTCVT